MITSNWEVSWAIPNWRYRCPAWAHLLAECPIQNPVFLLPALFGDCLSNKNKYDVFAGRSKEKVKRIVLCCSLPCKSYDKHWVYLCLIFERLIFKVCLFRNLERLKNWLACENRKNRTRPTRETPLWQGAKKDRCFRRPKMVGFAFGSEFECETFLGENNNTVLNITKWTQNKLW